MTVDQKRVLPVLKWLQVGGAAAAVGIALAGAPTATADDGGSNAAATRSSAQRQAPVRAARSGSDHAPAAARSASTPRPAAAVDGNPRASAAIAVPASTANPLTATGGVPAASAKAAAVTNSETVVNSLFHEMLRRDPTSTELKTYGRVVSSPFGGVSRAVTRIYNSTDFRQTVVNNYYLDMLGRTPTQSELRQGSFQLAWGSTEKLVASIAGTSEFYADSAAGGGTTEAGVVRVPANSTSFVNLLYRSLLGESADPTAAAIYIQQLQSGVKPKKVATEFVNSDAWRTVKVNGIYTVAEVTGDPAPYVSAWFRSGGLRGITTSILSSDASVANLNAGVALPDLTSGALLQGILLSGYHEFVAGLKEQLGTATTGCGPTGDKTGCNQAFYDLMSTGGLDRGIPNTAIDTTTSFVQVSNLIPTQSNVDMNQSLVYPLRDPATTQLYLTGGNISAPGGIILTADNGNYVIDGHHRWSALYVMNPYTSIASIDLGYVPTPQDGLKETQMGIAAREGYLPWKAADGPNLYTVDEKAFDQQVYNYLWTEDLNTLPEFQPPLGKPWPDQPNVPPDPGKPPRYLVYDTDPNSKGYQRPMVFNTFVNFLSLDGVPTGPTTGWTDAEKQQWSQPIEDYLWGNVLLMRQNNKPIPGATPRDDMPQPENNSYPPYLQLLDTGKVLYDMPVISYLS